MKPLRLSTALVLAVTAMPLAHPADAPKLTSRVYAFNQLPATSTPVGARRAAFDGPTATVDLAHCHVTTLNPGQRSGEPRVHRQEEIIILKEGTVEVHFDGQQRTARAGDIIFFAANATTHLHNTSDQPATYYVIYYFTPLTPKE